MKPKQREAGNDSLEPDLMNIGQGKNSLDLCQDDSLFDSELWFHSEIRLTIETWFNSQRVVVETWAYSENE